MEKTFNRNILVGAVIVLIALMMLTLLFLQMQAPADQDIAEEQDPTPTPTPSERMDPVDALGDGTTIEDIEQDIQMLEQEERMWGDLEEDSREMEEDLDSL